jgi:hypothetical protein
MQRLPRPSRLPVAGGLLSLVLLASACGSSGSDSSQVASLSTDGATGATTATTAPADSQEAWLAFAQCMRDNGVDMQDPTFDADGNLASGGIGPDSGVDMRDDAAQTAMTECGDLIADIGPGGGNGGPQFDRTAIQDALNSFTECLRDNGVQVDDVDFGVGPGGGPGGTPPDGAQPVTSGDVPAGGFGPPTDGSVPAGGAGPGGPGGDGFDPTDRIIEQLGLDDTDPTVTAALTACQAELDAAFTPAGDGTDATDTTTGS